MVSTRARTVSPAEGMPRTTKVLGQKFTVKAVKGLTVSGHDEQHESISLDIIGLCEPTQNTISVDTDMATDRFKEVFLHEHLHALIAMAGLTRDCITAEQDEAIAKRLAPILLLFLRDNPRVYTFLTGRRLW